MVRWLDGLVLGAALSTACAPAAPPDPELPRGQATAQRPNHVPDDPESCLDSATRTENAWERKTQQELLERMTSFSRCMPKGALAREERLIVTFRILPDRSIVEARSAMTTLPDCKMADCILDAFAKSSRGEAIVENGKTVSLWAVLRPDAAPELREPSDLPTWLKGATICDREKKSIGGRIPPETIQHVVRTAYGDFRKCYEQGLARSPTLEGRVSIRFVIDSDGRTENPTIQYNTLPDCSVAACVRDGFRKLTYSAPEGGIVTVTYPINFKPGP